MTRHAKSGNEKPLLGRAAQIGLTRERIVAEAVALIDEKGLAAFSMRELSRRLGVYPSAIYWHVGGLMEDLFAEISAAVTGHLMRPEDVKADWRDTLRTMFHRYRATVHEHPNVAPLLGAQLKSNGLPNANMVEFTLRALEQAGYEGQPLADAYNAVIGGLAGFVTMEMAPAPSDETQRWAKAFAERLDGIDPVAFPAMARNIDVMRNRSFVLRWQNGSHVPLDGGFDCLVESLIAGLESRSPKCSASSG